MKQQWQRARAGYQSAGRPVTSVCTTRWVTLSGPSPDSASVTCAASPDGATVDWTRPTEPAPASQDGTMSVTALITLALAWLDRASPVRYRVSGSSSLPSTSTIAHDAAMARTVSARSEAA